MIRDKDVIRLIVNRINQSVEDVKETEDSDFRQGMLEAYTDVINILKSVTAGEDLKNFDLDFDPEKVYL